MKKIISILVVLLVLCGCQGYRGKRYESVAEHYGVKFSYVIPREGVIASYVSNSIGEVYYKDYDGSDYMDCCVFHIKGYERDWDREDSYLTAFAKYGEKYGPNYVTTRITNWELEYCVYVNEDAYLSMSFGENVPYSEVKTILSSLRISDY